MPDFVRAFQTVGSNTDRDADEAPEDLDTGKDDKCSE